LRGPNTLAEQRRVASHLGAAYPQAVLRPLDSATFPAGDPARLAPDEQLAIATLQLRKGEHLPLRTLEDRDLDETSGSAQADPLLGVLAALSDFPAGWRALIQVVVLAPAPRDWTRVHQPLALEPAILREQARGTGPSLIFPLGLLCALALYLVGSSVAAAWDRGDWLSALEVAVQTLVAAVMAVL